MHYGILGRLEVRDGERTILPRAAQQRVVLAVLLLHANRPVSTDALVEALWGAQPPASAAPVLQNRVSQLRKLLGAGAIERTGTGYVLHADEEAIDARRFERLAREGREALDAGRWSRAAAVLGDALALWKGPPLADFTYDTFAQPEIARLEELRILALQDRIDADLACGRPEAVVPELEQLVTEHPLQERPRAQLMLALYRAGRQAEALEAYQDARRTLVDELGVDPGPELQALERAILTQDESIAGPRVAQPHRLRIPPTPLVGRSDELAELDALLSRPDVRLVTLVGPGGTGKTRLALAAASARRDFAHGAVFVSLEALVDSDLVVSTVARELGVAESGARPSVEVLADALRDQELLLVLDNFEQVAAAAPAVSALLVAAPKVKVMATSRVPLKLSGEHEYPVPPLPAPDAAALFSARALALDPAFDLDAAAGAVAEICARLDGLPLAIELAAARIKVLPPQALLERLVRGPGLLRGRGDELPVRQRTLRDTIDWSYRLLDDEERTLFRKVAVFGGSWSLQALETVCSEDDALLEHLEALLENSLVRRDRGHDDEARFTMLTTIRDDARERLVDAGEIEAAELRHAEWFVAFAESAHRRLIEKPRGDESEQLLERLERDHDNLRAALTWARDNARDELLLQLCIALRTFWHVRGHVREGTRWLDVALNASAGRPATLRAPVLHGVNVFAGLRGDRRREQETAAEALELYRELGDTRGTAVMLRASGAAASRDGDFGAAAAFYEESATLFRELDDRTALAIVISNLGDLALKEGHSARAWELCSESLALQRDLGSTFGAILSLCNLGYAALHEARVDDARAVLQEALLLAHDYGAHDMVGVALEGLAAVTAANAEWELTGRLLGSAEAIRSATGTELETAESLVHDRTIVFLRDSATAAEIDAWLAAGSTLSEEEAVALGLDVRAPAVR